MSTGLHHPHGSLAAGTDPVSLTSAQAGWTYTGLDVIELGAGSPRTFDTGDREVMILPLSATDVTVGVGDETFVLDGRETVFARVSDFLYIGRDSQFEISGASGEVAIASSHCDEALLPKYGPTDGIGIEVRGGGQATRQISNFGSPEKWSHADKIMCVEVYTPDGNWSSYPPHKHDDSPECEVNNEEIYYFRIGRAGTADYTAEGFGMHRTYTDDRVIDENVAVHDGDVFLVPRGYHGPCIAAPGYDMYYLNVLAGPAGERSMAFCDDPAHHWIRDEWADTPLDPRCPMVTADGKTHAGGDRA
ncbi:MAG: 5-deoxy-glucuronate isomerase [Actinomycetota bacterium]